MKKIYDIVRFALKVILIPAIAVLIIYKLNQPYRILKNEQYWDISKFALLGSQFQEVDIGNLGSSHGMYDFSYDKIIDKGYGCFNFANSSQTYNYDYALLKGYGHYMADDSVLFIPVSYFSFNNEVTNSKEAQAMSIRYYILLLPEDIPDYDLYVDIVGHAFPILSAGEDILRLLPYLFTTLTVHAANDGIDVEQYMSMAQNRYSRHFDDKDEYFLPERIADLYNIIDYCKENDITPVLITTPFSIYYNNLVSEDFLEEFYATIDKISRDTSVSYYDYSHDERFNDHLEYFADADHLNTEGAIYFTDILWDEVEELRRFH